MALARGVDVLDPGRGAVLDQHALDRRVGAELEQAARPRVVDVGVHRRLAGVRRAALEARAAAHAVRVRVGGDGLELDAEGAEAGLDRADALRPVGALADAEHLLDPVVVRLEVGGGEGLAALVREPARRVPLRDVALVGAQRDLRVDRGRAADAAAGEQGEHLAVGKRREPQRPPHVVRRLRLPADEVRGREVRADLEQEDVAAALRELACDDAAARAGAHDNDVEVLLHAIPR